MIGSTTVLVVELVMLFIGVSLLIEVVQRRVGPDRLRSWMGGSPVVAALKGIAVGFVTPFCTYSAIPMLVGLRRAGVPPAGYVAFLSAAPVLDPILFGALVLIVGAQVAIGYLLVTFVAAMALALVAGPIGVERHLRPLDVRVPVVAGGTTTPAAPTDAVAGACDADEPWQGWPTEGRRGLLASARLLRAFGPLMLLGVAIGVTIEALVSPAAAARVTTGNPLGAIPLAAAIGSPLYFNTELFVPIANSLHAVGVGDGAIVALTIAGAGVNIPEFVVLSKLARPGALAVFVGYVVMVAVTGGLLAHVLGGR